MGKELTIAPARCFLQQTNRAGAIRRRRLLDWSRKSAVASALSRPDRGLRPRPPLTSRTFLGSHALKGCDR